MADDLDEIIESAKTAAGVYGVRAKIQQVSDRRDTCHERGYHLLGSKKEYDAKPKGDLCICTECELFFGKSDDFVLKVEFIED